MADEKDGFWWYVILEGGPGSEEILASLADLSGSIGSEERADGMKVRLRSYYRSSQDLGYWIERLNEALVPWEDLRIADMGKIENRRWHTEWKEAFPPLPVGEGFVVLAPWHRGSEPEGRIPLYIYPGSAFGTGYHESTQIVLCLLEETVRPGMTGADIGTGSGILAIAAVRLGARHVRARDLDPAVLSEVRHNLSLNDIPEDDVSVEEGNLLEGLTEPVDFVTANIVLDPLLDMLPSVGRVLKPGGTVLFSGLTVRERERFGKAMGECGLEAVRQATMGDWWGVAAVKRDGSRSAG